MAPDRGVPSPQLLSRLLPLTFPVLAVLKADFTPAPRPTESNCPFGGCPHLRNGRWGPPALDLSCFFYPMSSKSCVPICQVIFLSVLPGLLLYPPPGQHHCTIAFWDTCPSSGRPQASVNIPGAFVQYSCPPDPNALKTNSPRIL